MGCVQVEKSTAGNSAGPIELHRQSNSFVEFRRVTPWVPAGTLFHSAIAGVVRERPDLRYCSGTVHTQLTSSPSLPPTSKYYLYPIPCSLILKYVLALTMVNTVEQRKDSTGNQENISSSPVTKKLCDQEEALTL